MNTNHSNFTIYGHHIEVTPALEDNIKNIANKLTHKFQDLITDFRFTIKIDSTVHPHLQEAEAEVSLRGKKEKVFAKASSVDMYDSLHVLKGKLERQILKHKELNNGHHEKD